MPSGPGMLHSSRSEWREPVLPELSNLPLKNAQSIVTNHRNISVYTGRAGPNSHSYLLAEDKKPMSGGPVDVVQVLQVRVPGPRGGQLPGAPAAALQLVRCVRASPGAVP